MSSIFRIDVAKQDNRWTKSTHVFFGSVPVLLIFFTLFGTLASCAMRIFMESYDFTTRLTAMLMFVALSQANTLFLNIAVNMEKLSALYQTLQSIVNAGIIRFCFA